MSESRHEVSRDASDAPRENSEKLSPALFSDMDRSDRSSGGGPGPAPERPTGFLAGSGFRVLRGGAPMGVSSEDEEGESSPSEEKERSRYSMMVAAAVCCLRSTCGLRVDG